MLLALLIVGAVTVEGDTTCPSATRVSEVLATLLTTVDSREAHHARLREHPDGIEVELRSGLGRPLAQRTFSRDASCEELASAIAVVIATWETGFAGDTPDIRVSARPALVVVETPPSTTITLAGGALVAFDRLGGSAGGLAGIVIGSARTRWSGRFAALAMTRKREPLAAGSQTRVAPSRSQNAIANRCRDGDRCGARRASPRAELSGSIRADTADASAEGREARDMTGRGYLRHAVRDEDR